MCIVYNYQFVVEILLDNYGTLKEIVAIKLCA